MNGHAPILYWFPGCTKPPPEYAARFVPGHSSGGPTSCGPEPDRRGLLLAPHGGTCAYLPDHQRWDRIGPDAWIGARRDCTPDTFRRPQTIPGQPVRMGDGRWWEIPTINPLVGTCSLPLWDILDPEGNWTKQVTDAHAHLATRVREYAHLVMDQAIGQSTTTLTVDNDPTRQLIADAIALNYHLTIHELSVLRLYATDMYGPTISAILDLPALIQTVHAAMEGGPTVPFGPSPDPDATSPGAPGSTPATAPPVQTSSS